MFFRQPRILGIPSIHWRHFDLQSTVKYRTAQYGTGTVDLQQCNSLLPPRGRRRAGRAAAARESASMKATEAWRFVLLCYLPASATADTSATCLPGAMSGGNLAVLNFTLPAAVSFCANNARCAGFTSQSPYPATCNSTTQLLQCFFKDHYGAVRRNPKAKGWSSWVVSPPAPPPPPPAPAPAPVVVDLAPANQSRGLPLLGFGTELVWQSTNDSGLLATASVAAGSSVARYPGGTPSNYWDWSCAHGNNTCCTEVSLAKGEKGKCSGAMGQAATKPSAWADFVRTKPAQRPTIFDLNVVQTNASYQLRGLRTFEQLGVPIQRLELG
eukprot:COSAG05_NODE_1350_length_5113_cov_5.235540_3_plen_327_part_00